MRHLGAWLALWIGCWWLWVLLAGEWNRYEWIAAAAAATIAATLGEIALARVGVAGRLPWRTLARAWTVPAVVVTDFALVLWALVRGVVRRELPRGTFRSRKARPGPPAWLMLTATYSPNAYVVEIEDGTVLLHDLVPFAPSEEPA